MAERAHPDDPGFLDKDENKTFLKFFKIKKRTSNPYRDALFWRYGVVNKYCAGRRVLDVPCGMGWGTSLLVDCQSLDGLDISEDAVAEARKRYSNKASFHVGSMGKLPFLENSFDLISCLEGIEHVPKEVARNFLCEASRVLSVGGRLLLSSPHCNNAPHSGNPYHIYEYQPEEMSELLSRWFLIEKVESRIVDNLTISMFFAVRPKD